MLLQSEHQGEPGGGATPSNGQSRAQASAAEGTAVLIGTLLAACAAFAALCIATSAALLSPCDALFSAAAAAERGRPVASAPLTWREEAQPLFAAARDDRSLVVLPLSRSDDQLVGLSNYYTFRYRPLISSNSADPRELLTALARDLALHVAPDARGAALALRLDQPVREPAQRRVPRLQTHSGARERDGDAPRRHRAQLGHAEGALAGAGHAQQHGATVALVQDVLGGDNRQPLVVLARLEIL
jgi:hypothetical protein